MSARRRDPRTARRAALAALATAAIAVAAWAPATATAAVPRASLPAIEREVMCVTCKIPLEVAESPQADRERALIRELIARGQDEAEIKRALVGEYGRAVLGLPAASGFDLAAYLVPAGVLLALLGLLALLLPRWRAQAHSSPSPPVAGSGTLSVADAERLERDLASFD